MSFLPIRLTNHGLTTTGFKTPHEVVDHLGAMQAQDFARAKRGVGCRVHGSTDKSIQQALADRQIIRTRPMRGTLHFVAPENVRRMLDLCASKTIPGFAKRRAYLGMDDKIAEKSLEVFEKVLRGNNVLTRAEMIESLSQSGIPIQTQRGYHLLCYAATRKLICFGPPQGKDDTFVLLDERLPTSKTLNREESLARLAEIYFGSHGPATIQDLARRSGLPIGDTKKGVALLGKKLHSEEKNNLTYYFIPSEKPQSQLSSTLLLAAFDEYFLGYKDRSIVSPKHHHSKILTTNGIFFPTIVIDGEVVGTRKRSFKKETVTINITIFEKKTEVDKKELEQQAEKYMNFMGMKGVVINY